MKKQVLFAALISFIFPALLFAQKNSDSTCFFKPYSFDLSGGMTFYNGLPLTNFEMRMIAPNSQLLNQNFSNFPQQSFYGYSITGNTGFSAGVSFKIYNRKQNKFIDYSSVHAGFCFAPVQIDGPSYYRQNSQPIDTLYPGNGSTIYDDSISSENYDFNWGGKFLGVDLNQIFHTNDQHVFSFYTGYGLHAGMVLNTAFRGDYYKLKYLQTTTTPGGLNTTAGTSQSGSTWETQQEVIKTKSVFCAGIYFPLGMQIRLSRKNNFWNKLCFTTEFRTGIDFQGVPNNGIMTRFYAAQSVGMKYYFQNNATR